MSSEPLPSFFPKAGEPLPKYIFCIPFWCAASAFVVLFVGTSCNFLSFTSLDAVSNPTGDNQPLTLHFGYWAYQSWTLTNDTSTSTVLQESCILYPSSINIDKNWKAARVFSLIAIIAGGSILMMDCFQGCMSTKRHVSFRTGAIGYFICCLSAGLSLIILDSNVCKNNTLIDDLSAQLGIEFQETCSMSQGGKSTIASTVLFFVAAVGTGLLHPAQKKKEHQSDRIGGGDDDGLDEPLFNEETSVL